MGRYEKIYIVEIIGKGSELHHLNVFHLESVDLALDVYAVGPTQSQHGKEHKVARVVLDLLPHIKALSGFQPW